MLEDIFGEGIPIEIIERLLKFLEENQSLYEEMDFQELYNKLESLHYDFLSEQEQLYKGLTYLLEQGTNLSIEEILKKLFAVPQFFCSNRIGIKTLNIPSNIERIEDQAFRDCPNLTEVSLPEELTYIGHDAFQSCASLPSITLPDSLITIKDRAFMGCKNLTNISIPNKVTEICSGTFSLCDSLSQVDLGSGIQNIGMYAFYKCSSLQDIIIHKGIRKIENGAFESAIIGKLKIESDSVEVDPKAFISCAVLKLDSPINVAKKIPKEDIIEMNLTPALTGGDTVIPACFANNSTDLKHLILGEGITVIDSFAFKGCDYLEGSLKIPDSVIDINHEAFKDCTQLTSISLPENIKFIANNAFENCYRIREVYYRGTEKQWEDFVSINGRPEFPANAKIHILK